MTALHLQAFANSNRDEKKHPEPFAVPLPWSKAETEPEATDEEKAVLRATLARRSVFRELD